MSACQEKGGWSSLVVQWVKGPVLSLQLLWPRFDSWCRNFHMPLVQPKKTGMGEPEPSINRVTYYDPDFEVTWAHFPSFKTESLGVPIVA